MAEPILYKKTCAHYLKLIFWSSDVRKYHEFIAKKGFITLSQGIIHPTHVKWNRTFHSLVLLFFKCQLLLVYYRIFLYMFHFEYIYIPSNLWSISTICKIEDYLIFSVLSNIFWYLPNFLVAYNVTQYLYHLPPNVSPYYGNIQYLNVVVELLDSVSWIFAELWYSRLGSFGSCLLLLYH